MNLKVICQCKNVEPAGEFICRADPDGHGNYLWMLNKSDGSVFGGMARSQKEAIDDAFKPTIMEKMDGILRQAEHLRKLTEEL